MSENLFGLTVAADKGLDDLQCQRLLSENRRYQEVMLQYRCALKALESRLEILNEEFSLQHDRNPIESMKSRLKSPSSIMNKMQKRGLPLDFPTMQANIMDVAGVRVICSFEEDVFFLAKCLKKQSDIEIITEKDYISHPKPEAKPAASHYPALCYSAECFFFLLTTAAPITAPPLASSNAIHSMRLLLSPVGGDFGSFAITVSTFLISLVPYLSL